MPRHFSRVRLFATPGTVAHQAPLSMGLSRQEYWSGQPLPPPGDLPDPGSEPISPAPPALQAGSLPTEPLGKPRRSYWSSKNPQATPPKAGRELGGSSDGRITAVFSLLLANCLSCRVLMAQRVKLKQERRVIFPADPPFLPFLHRRVWIFSPTVPPASRLTGVFANQPSLPSGPPELVPLGDSSSLPLQALWPFPPERGCQAMALSCDRIWETLSPVQRGVSMQMDEHEHFWTSYDGQGSLEGVCGFTFP